MKLVLQKSAFLDDWYLIERAEHNDTHRLGMVEPGVIAVHYSGRVSDADVEGTPNEMIAIADAIFQRSAVSFRRCAVDVGEMTAEFWSPRNSTRSGEVSVEEAHALAVEIYRELCPDVQICEPGRPAATNHEPRSALHPSVGPDGVCAVCGRLTSQYFTPWS